MFFFDPTQIAAGEAPADKRFRLGGMVEKGSVQKTAGHARRAVPGHGFQAHGAGEIFRHPCRTCSARGRAWWRMAACSNGTFVADEILAKHDEKYMPPEVAKSLKDNPPPPDSHRRRHRYLMIPELGQFALVLALLHGGGAGRVRPVGRASRRSALDGRGQAGGRRTVRADEHRGRRADPCLRQFRLLGAVRGQQFQLGAADVLSRRGAVGRARRLAAAVGLDPGAVDAGGRRRSAATCRRVSPAA